MRDPDVRAGRRPRQVAIVQRELPSYRLPFYERLREDLARRDIDLVLVRSGTAGSGRLPGDEGTLRWARSLPAREFGVGHHRVLWQPLDRAVRDADLVIVEQASRLLLNYVLLARQMIFGRPLAFWGHGRSFHPAESNTGFGEWVKRQVSRHVHWWFAYNELSAQVVRELGFPPQRTTVVHNSTDTRALRRLVGQVAPDEAAATRRELGLRPGSTAMFVGNFHPEKQLSFLFEACEHLHEAEPDFSLLLVGAGIEQGLVEQMAERRPYVHYLGNRFGADLASCFAVADVLLVPGWAGLVIVDGFAAGVPIMPSATFPHPPEISYLDSGHNGVLVEDDGSPATYAERVREVLTDPIEHRRLVDGCAIAAETYSVESMAASFARGVEHALSARAGR